MFATEERIGRARSNIGSQDSVGKSINIKAMFLYAGLSTQTQSLVLRPVSRGLVQQSCLLLSDGLLEGQLLLGGHRGHGAHHVGHAGTHQRVGRGQGGGGGGRLGRAGVLLTVAALVRLLGGPGELRYGVL